MENSGIIILGILCLFLVYRLLKQVLVIFGYKRELDIYKTAVSINKNVISVPVQNGYREKDNFREPKKEPSSFMPFLFIFILVSAMYMVIQLTSDVEGENKVIDKIEQQDDMQKNELI